MVARYPDFRDFMSFIELMVAFIQAYIFTILSALFIGLAIEDHGHEHESEHKTQTT